MSALPRPHHGDSISRQAFLEGVAEHFPSLYHFVASCYLNSPSLCLLTPDGVDCIQSSEGVQQGDPLGPFLFSLALHPCLKMAAEKCEQGFVVSYLDDAIVAGPKTDVLAAYDCLQQEMKAIGLHIRPDKCEALSMIPVPDWSLPIPFTTDGMQVLGCPVGSDSFVQRQCVKYTQNRLPFLKKLRCMRNLQSAMLLLRYCGVPTITHLLRSAAPHNVAEAAAQHDLDILDTFQSIIGISATVQQKSQISLPISLGGFGLLSAASASPCAFLGSWASTLAFLPERLPQFPSAPLDINVTPPDLVHHCLELLKKSFSAISEVLPSIEALPEKALKLQSRLTRCLADREFDNLITVSDQRSKARLRSAACSEAGASLDALPSSRELSFTSAEFQTATLLRLGGSIPMLRQIRRCNCGAEVDDLGYHVITCAVGSGATRRNNAIQFGWLKMLQSVNYVCDLEREHQLDNSNKRPDIGVFNFNDGKKLLLDVSIAHPQASTVLPQSAKNAGHAASERDNFKIKKFREEANKLGYLFEPLVMEVFGRWSPIALRILRQVAERPSIDFFNDKNSFLAYWRRHMAVCLQRENARIILRKVKCIVPHSPVCVSVSSVDTSVRCFNRD